MKNTFGTKNKTNYGFNSENERMSAAQASSPDQLAIVWNGPREIIAVSPVFNEASGSFDIDLARLSTDLNITAALEARRKTQANVSSISARTHILTVVPDYSERTRILALSGNVLALRDGELSEWLINAEREMYLGTDSHPVFETALEDTSCVVTRLHNGQVSMTEVARPQIDAIRERIYTLLGVGTDVFHNLVVETPLRCVARYFLTSQPEGESVLRRGKEKEVTAFLLIGNAGFSYGLWSPFSGLFSEYAFVAPNEIKAYKPPQAGRTPESFNKIPPHLLEAYIREAFDQLFLQLSPEKLEQMELSSYAQAVWVTDPNLTDLVAPIAAEYATATGLDFHQVKAPMDEAIAGGLLLGSFTFGDDRIVGAEVLPPINLARDILVLADKEELERQRQQEVYSLKKRGQAAFALWVAPVLMLAVLLGMVANLFRGQIMTGIREARADARAVELKPAVERRKLYETNLKWYQEFIKQVSALRRQQPVGTSLLYELNSNYPLNIDQSFYVSELKLAVNGGVEIKGLARNKDAITSFLRALEYAGGNESGKRLFSNLTYEVQEGVDQNTTGGQAKLPTMQGSTLSGSNPAPGVIAWTMRGNYLPVVEFLPPDPKKTAPPNQPPPANAPNQQTPPAANQQPAANTAKPTS